MSTNTTPTPIAAAVTPATPYIALICTVERLLLRDVSEQTSYFNVNLATAIVADTDAAAQAFVTGAEAANLKYLLMWEQALEVDANGNLLFDLFTISDNTIAYSASHGSATKLDAASLAICKPCQNFLADQLDQVRQLTTSTSDNYYGLLRWQPNAPSGAVDAEAPGSVYQPVAWRHTVAHASTWPRPIPQGLNLSFEVGVPQASLNGVDSILLYPRFAADTVDPNPAHLYQPLQAGDPWNSYAAKYATSPRWVFQPPCSVQPKQSSGLVDPATYWIMKDASAASDSTSDWRQGVEALIENRFDYLPRLLGVLTTLLANGKPSDPSTEAITRNIWHLGQQMLMDLSTIGADPLLEGTTLQKTSSGQQAGPAITPQYTLLLRAVEAIYSFPANGAPPTPGNSNKAQSFVQMLSKTGTDLSAWTKQIGPLIQGLDSQLYQAFSNPMFSGPTPNITFQNVVPLLQRFYGILSDNDNLSAFLPGWWNSVISAMLPVPGDWNDMLTALKNKILPPAQLHNRYLSAIAAKSKPMTGSLAPMPLDALGLPFPGRSEHSTVWNAAGQLIVFGGYTSATSTSATHQDTWTLNVLTNGSWTEVISSGNPPAARRAHSAVMDTAQTQMLVYGGFDSNGAPLNDLFRLTLSGYSLWTPVVASGGPSGGRGGHSAVYDQANSKMIVFGGGVGNPPAATAEVWILSNATGQGGAPAWTQLTPTGGPPNARMFHSAVYDPGSNRMIVFAGTSVTGATPYNDLWILTNANGTGGTPVWIPLTPTGNLPAIRSNHTAVYDTVNNRMIVYAGEGSNGALGDAWVLTNANGQGGNAAWSPLTPAGDTVPARWGHTAVYNQASNSMLIFSGANAFVPDLYTLSNANGQGGAPAWTQLNPPGLPQLDAAVRAAVAGWVLASASAANLDPAFVATLIPLVVSDVNNSQTGLSTVAPEQPQKTKRPHPVVIQAGGWSATDNSGQNTSGQEDRNEDLRRYAGVGILIRTRNLANNTATPWRCINATDISVNYQNQSAQITASFVASRLQYRNGMKDPFISYDNQPLIAKSPTTSLSGQFAGGMGPSNVWTANTLFNLGAVIKDSNGHKQQCTQAGTSGATSPAWNNQNGVTRDGQTLQWTDQGVWLNLLTYAPATGTYGAFYGLIFGVTYEFAPFAISHGGAMPIAIQPSATAPINDSIQFDDPDVIRQATYLRRVPIGHLRIMSASATNWSPNSSVVWPVIQPTVYPLTRDVLPSQGQGKDLPLLLLPFSSSAQQPAFEPFAFKILPPATDINTWDRWVAYGSVYKAGTANTRKAVWAAYHRDSTLVTGPANAGTNRIGDPAVSALMLKLEWLDLSQPAPAWTPMPDVQTQWVDVVYNPVPTGAYDSNSAWMAVNPAPALVTVQNGGQFQLTSDGSGGFIVTVPALGIARLTVSSLIADGDYTGQFEQGVFTPESVVRPASANPAVPARNYRVLGSSFSVIAECPSNASVSPDDLNSNLNINFVAPRTVEVALTMQSTFRSVGIFELQRQDWRWLGRPLPDLDPTSATNQQAWETLAFIDRRDDDYISSSKRFSPVSNNANPPLFSQTLASIDLSNDRRCQFIRFSAQGHNRYEEMPFFQAAPVTSSSTSGTSWKTICVPRDPDLSTPPKPVIRLVVPLMQRTTNPGKPQADLLVIADESWYRIGGLGETLAGQIQPVLGTEMTTILGTTYQYIIQGRFNGDAGVIYLDSGIALQKTTVSPLDLGYYSVQGNVYTFSPADSGQNVAISYSELDTAGDQLYEFGPDQIVSGEAAATTQQPQVVLRPMGATLEDTSVGAPNFTNTYFSAQVSQAGLVSWNHFKVQFRRELHPVPGDGLQKVCSDWTDAVWVQTLPDAATFVTKTATGTGTIACSDIQCKWSSPSGFPSTLLFVDGSQNQLSIVPTTSTFQLWYVVTQTVTDAFGNQADIYFPPSAGTQSAPQFQFVAGQVYKLRIVEVQVSPVPWAPAVFDDSNFLNMPLWQPGMNYQIGQIVIDSKMKHIRKVSTPGKSGNGPEPSWNNGSQTQEQSGLIWDDKGVWNGDETLRIVRISPSISIAQS